MSTEKSGKNIASKTLIVLTKNEWLPHSGKKKCTYEAKLWPGKYMVSITVAEYASREWLMWFEHICEQHISTQTNHCKWSWLGYSEKDLYFGYYILCVILYAKWMDGSYNFPLFLFWRIFLRGYSAQLFIFSQLFEKRPKQSNDPRQKILIMIAASPSRIIKQCKGANGRRQIGELAQFHIEIWL